MVELELDKSAVKTIEKALETLKEDRVQRVCQDLHSFPTRRSSDL